MRLLALLSPCVLVACSVTATVTGNDSGTNPDGSSNPDGGGDPDASGNPDSSPVVEYCPTGYTLTPFLSATATTHKYSMADQVADSSKDYVAVLETTAGRIVWHFHLSVAPLASNSFIFLALHHYFDGIAFHRVVPGFVAQGGDPNTIPGPRSTWGTGGPGYSFADELTPPPNYAAYTVAMANSGANTNGSQFFIDLADENAALNPKAYTLFADLTEGMSVLPMIATSPDPNGFTPPATPTVITDVHICQK